MNNIRFSRTLICLGVIFLATRSFATDDGYLVNSGSNDWNSANWTLGHAPYNSDYGFITNTPANGTVNIIDLNGSWSSGFGGGFTINNTGSTGTNLFLVNNGGSFSADYITVGQNGRIEVTSGGYFIDWQQLNIQSGGVVYLNGGSISVAGYSQGNVIGIAGTMIADNGTFDGTYNGTANALDVQNGGQLIANSGVFRVNTGSEDTYHGLRIDAGGQVIVNSGATFLLNRWNQFGNWYNDTPDNLGGTIILNNGTFAFSDDIFGVASNAANSFGYNNGTIVGSGYLLASWKQENTSQIIASNGTLHIFGTDVNGNQGTFTPNNPNAYGTFHALSGATLAVDGNVAGGFGGAWLVDSGGSLEVASGQSVDLGAAYMPGSNILGTVKVNSGANLTLSSTASGGGYQDNQGTFLLLNGVVYMPNDPAHAVTGEFTNSATGAITGNGTFQTGFGQGGGNVNFAIVNHGIITATNGTLVLNTSDANNLGGVQNAVDGTIVLANSGTLAVARTQNAWNNSGAVTNFGNIQMNGGDVSAVSVDGGTPSTKLANASGGLIRGNGTIDSGWSQLNNNGTIFANSQTPLVLGATTLNNNSGGVVTANTASIIINGAFNIANGGTFASVHSVGTFNGPVVNSGAWITDPTTNVFNNTYTATSSGYISASAGDVYRFRSNFVNQSTQNTSYNTLNTTPGGSGASGTKFVFDNASVVGTTLTQQYFTAGLKLTGGFVGTPSPTASGVQFVSSFPAVTGFNNNFALDRLEIGNAGTNSILELSASADIGGASGDTNALFVNDLWLFGSSDLIISNNTVLYFVNSNDFSSADITLLGNGEIHQLDLQQVSSVPEPSVVLLWLCGLGTAYGASRRAKKRRKRS